MSPTQIAYATPEPVPWFLRWLIGDDIPMPVSPVLNELATFEEEGRIEKQYNATLKRYEYRYRSMRQRGYLDPSDRQEIQLEHGLLESGHTDRGRPGVRSDGDSSEGAQEAK